MCKEELLFGLCVKSLFYWWFGPRKIPITLRKKYQHKYLVVELIFGELKIPLSILQRVVVGIFIYPTLLRERRMSYKKIVTWSYKTSTDLQGTNLSFVFQPSPAVKGIHGEEKERTLLYRSSVL